MVAPKTRILIGDALVNFPMCLAYIECNMIPYICSYFQLYFKTNNTSDFNPERLLPAMVICQTIGALLATVITRYIDIVKGTLCGIIFLVLAHVLTYFALYHSVWMTFLTLSIMGGIGNGVLQVLHLALLVLWFDSNMGQASAMVLSSVGMGVVTFNLIIRAYLNPSKLSLGLFLDDAKLWTTDEILVKIPATWAILATVTTFFHLLGYLFIYSAKASQMTLMEALSTTKKDDPSSELKKICGIYQSTGFPTMLSDTNRDNNDNKNTLTINTKEHIKSLSDTKQIYGSYPPQSPLSPHSTTSIESDESHEETKHLTCSHKQANPPRLTRQDSQDTETDMTLKEIFTAPPFYSVMFSLAALTVCDLIVFSKHYKMIELWIETGTWYLALTAYLTPIAIFLLRFISGRTVDKFGVKACLSGILALVSLCIILWYLSGHLCVAAMHLSFDFVVGLMATKYLLMPMIALKLYGAKHLTFVYGIFTISPLIVSLSFPTCLPLLVGAIGWFWVTLIGSSCAIVALVLVLITLNEDQ